MDIDSYSNDELGRMVKHLAKGREYECRETKKSKNGLMSFLSAIGLTWLVEKIAPLIDPVVKGIWKAICWSLGVPF